MDNAHILEKSFEKMGARLKIDVFPAHFDTRSFRVNVLRDKKGEYFHIGTDEGVDLKTVDVKPKDRHLLLHAEDAGGKHKFLCGHDERQWFVAAVPTRGTGVTNVRAAKEALKPQAVIQNQSKTKAKTGGRRSRRNAAYIRQGEWFFVPEPNLNPLTQNILYNEPIRRGRGKPHMCEMLCRANGEQVYVDWKHPNGINQDEFNRLPEKARKRSNWRVMVRDADVYVKGRITHPDHATVVLRDWCRVRPNRETEAPSMRHVAFLD